MPWYQLIHNSIFQIRSQCEHCIANVLKICINHVINIASIQKTTVNFLTHCFPKIRPAYFCNHSRHLETRNYCDDIYLSEMLDVTYLPSGCPMTTVRKGRRYLATVAKGKATSLQGDQSEVNLEIQEGCPERAYLMEVRTDPSSFWSIIPNNECFISPIVEVLAPAETNTSSYVLRIPHCLDEEDDKTKVKVRMIHDNRNPAVKEVPKGNAGALYYNIDARFIELHTTHFTKVICTICQTPYHCRERINNLWFARYDTPEQTQKMSHNVEIRPYFGGLLYSIVDFRKVWNRYHSQLYKEHKSCSLYLQSIPLT